MARAVTVGRNGRIVAAGFTDFGSGIRDVAVARFANDLRTPYPGRYPDTGGRPGVRARPVLLLVS